MYLLKGNIRSYEWGSTSLLAHAMGRPSPTQKPEAEAWYGAHPGAPSPLIGTTRNNPKAGGGPRNLHELIAADPFAELGPGHDELPFLVKLLAAERALSIQAHPSKQQAERGFAADNARGLSMDDPDRNYRDANHKPELLVALSEFDALAGFRPLPQTIELLNQLNVPELAGVSAQLREVEGNESAIEGTLRTLISDLLTLPAGEAARMVDAVVAQCASLMNDASLATVPSWMRLVAHTVVELQDGYPGDPGILVAILLNRVKLAPGEAIFLGAGQLHAYLHGLGVEVMANSDNVLRGGLTAKHIDVPELVRVLDATPLADPRCERVGNVYNTQVPEFTMTVVPQGDTVTIHGPAVVLAVNAEETVTGAKAATRIIDGDAGLDVPAGNAAWVSHSDGAVAVSAQVGAAYVVTV